MKISTNIRDDDANFINLSGIDSALVFRTNGNIEVHVRDRSVADEVGMHERLMMALCAPLKDAELLKQCVKHVDHFMETTK
jgi:hypothetical protein